MSHRRSRVTRRLELPLVDDDAETTIFDPRGRRYLRRGSPDDPWADEPTLPEPVPRRSFGERPRVAFRHVIDQEAVPIPVEDGS